MNTKETTKKKARKQKRATVEDDLMAEFGQVFSNDFDIIDEERLAEVLIEEED